MTTGSSMVRLTFLAGVALALLPLATVAVPPLVDYPNHLARMHILADPESPTLAQFYAVAWRPLPDLAMDAVVPFLAHFMPLEKAARVFVGLSIVLPIIGTMLLHRALHRRVAFWPLLAFLFVFNRTLLWGFLNYLCGLGLALCALAAWIGFAKRRWRRGLVIVPLALAVYFSHLAAFGVFAVVLAGVEIPRAVAAARRGGGLPTFAILVEAGLPLLLPVGLFLSSWQPSLGTAGWPALARKPDLLFGVFDNYDRPFDILCFASLVGTVVWLAMTDRLRLAPVARWPLILLFAVYLLLPSRILTGAGADHRLPPAIFLLAVAGSGISVSAAAGRRIAVLAGLLFILRMGVVEWVWLRADSDYVALARGLDTLAIGDRLAVGYGPREVAVSAEPLLHLPLLAVARRDAFVPTLFADPAQQPVVFAPPYDLLAQRTDADALWRGVILGNQTALAAVRPTLKTYDALVLIGDRSATAPILDCLAPILERPRFLLVRIDQACLGAATP